MTAGRAFRHRGFTLVELMVSLAIGLLVVLAATRIVARGESVRRSTTAANDVGQTGAYAMYALDRLIRSAGSGFGQAANFGVFGCLLQVARPGDSPPAVLPRGSAFPAPFAGFPGSGGSVRMAPVLIGIDQSAAGSDVLMVMGGNASLGDMPRPLRTLTSPNALRLDNTLGLEQNDLVLLSRPGTGDCLLEQVFSSPAFAGGAAVDTLPLGGTYFTAGGSGVAPLSTFGGGSGYLTALGNAGDNMVQFQLLGVGDNNALYAYDLLRSGPTDASQAIADNVVALRALYGVSANASSKTIDSWVAPSGDFALDKLSVDAARLQRILAVRVALVLRSARGENEPVSPSELILFGDLPALQRKVSVDAAQQKYRYRVVESTIPLRNQLLTMSSPPPPPPP